MSPTVLAHTDLNVKEGEDVDVVDFADLEGLGKLTGSEHTPNTSNAAPPSRPTRAVASDFFEPPAPHRPPPPPSKADEGPWRRRASIVRPPPSLPEKPQVPNPDAIEAVPDNSAHPNGASNRRPSVSQASGEDHFRRVSGHLPNGSLKPPLSPHYREAPMAALDDAISRIKGALDGMHTQVEEPKEPAKPAKWLPPALRQKSPHDLPQPTEVFSVTAAEPPKSPKPAWNVFAVKLGHSSRPIPPAPRIEATWPRGQRFMRLQVFSLDVLDRRDTTVNDIVINRPRMIHGQPKYFVSIPRVRLVRRTPGDKTPSSPVVNLPTTPPRTRPANPKESGPPTWRKVPTSPSTSWRPLPKDAVQETGLDTVSRSPPPEAPPPSKAAAKGPPQATETVTALSASPATHSKTFSGSDVTFYRTSQSVPTGPQPPMQFTMTSELIGESKLGLEMMPPLAPTSVVETASVTTLPEVKPETSAIPVSTVLILNVVNAIVYILSERFVYTPVTINLVVAMDEISEGVRPEGIPFKSTRS